MYSADRATHFKIVAVALSLTLAVVLVGVHSRPDVASVASSAPVKAKTTVALTSNAARAVR